MAALESVVHYSCPTSCCAPVGRGCILRLLRGAHSSTACNRLAVACYCLASSSLHEKRRIAARQKAPHMFSAFVTGALLRRCRQVVTSLPAVLSRPEVGRLGYSTSTAGQETLEQIRSRIFGTHIGNGLRSGRKVLRKKLVGEKIAAYYPVPLSKSDPLFVNLDVERRKIKLEKLKRRGKAPPKKGEGKRAGRKKKK